MGVQIGETVSVGLGGVCCEDKGKGPDGGLRKET